MKSKRPSARSSRKGAPVPAEAKILVGFGTLIIPFLFTSRTIDPVLMPRMTALALFLVGFALFLLIKRKTALRKWDASLLRRPIFAAYLLFWIFEVLSLTQAINLAEGLIEVLRVGVIGAYLVVAAVMILADEKTVVYFARGYSLAAVGLSLVALAQYFGLAGEAIPSGTVVAGTMVNKNLLTAALILMLPFALYSLFVDRGEWRMLSMAAVLLGGVVIGIVRNRGALVAVGAATIVVVIFSLWQGKELFPASIRRVYLKRVMALVGAALVIVVLATVATRTRTEAVPRLKWGLRSSQASIEARLEMWKRTLPMIGEHPLLGVGAGNWKILLPKYGLEYLPAASGRVHYVRPHNDFLWVLAETGPGGFVGYVGIFLLGLWYAFRIVTRSSNPSVRLLGLLLGGGLIAYLAVSLVSFPRERIAHSVLMMTSLAILTVVYHKTFPYPQKAGEKRSPGIRLILGATIPVLLAAAVVGSIRIHMEIHANHARAARSKAEKISDPARKAAYLQYALQELTIAESPLANMDPMVTPLAHYRGECWVGLGNLSKAFEEFQNAYRLHPYHLLVLSQLAVCYQKLGNSEKSIELFRKVLTIAPANEHVRINLAAIYYHQGKYQEAYQVISKCDPRSNNPRLIQLRQALAAKLGAP